MTQCLLTLIFIIPRVCLLSVTPSFCFRQELVPSPPTLRVFYFEIQLYTVYCQCSMCWVSKLLLLSYYCGNVCLSLPCQRWPLPGPQTGCLTLQWFSFARVRNIFPFSGERKKSLWRISDKSPTQGLLCPCQVSTGAVCWWSQWVIGTTCYEMRVATL